jgi:hypothetical protein
MHAIDLTALATIADLQGLIEDAQAEIARREAQARDQALVELEALAKQYGKTVEAFLNFNVPAHPSKPTKAPTKKAPPRKKTLEEATAGLRLTPRESPPANGTPPS